MFCWRFFIYFIYFENLLRLISLKSEFIPYLCKKQFSIKKKHLKTLKEKANQSYDTSKSNTGKPKLYDYIKLNEYSNLVDKLSMQVNLDLLPCYAFIQADGFCLRTNNVAIYAEANRQVNNISLAIYNKNLNIYFGTGVLRFSYRICK